MWAWLGSLYELAWLWPVNEAVWEHLKMSITPILMLAFIEYVPLRRESQNFFLAKGISMLIAIGMVLGGFYTYTYFTGDSILFMDITLFYLGLILGQFAAYNIQVKTKQSMLLNLLGVLIVVVLLLCIIIFTYFPPEIELFIDGNTRSYGIP